MVEVIDFEANPPVGTVALGERHCLNCGTRFDGRFCSSCGQDSTEGTPSLAEWIREAFSEVASFDSRIWKSLRTLVTRPGHLTLAWLEGRRQSYTRPLRLFLLAVILLVLSSAIWRTEGGFLAGFLEGALSDGAGPDDATRAAAAFLSRTIQWFGLAMVPMTAGIVAGFFRRRPFAVHLVTVLHVFTFTILGYVLVLHGMELATALSAPGWVGSLLTGVLGLTVLHHLFRALAAIYEEPPVRAAIKTVGIALITLVTWVVGAVIWVTARSA